MVALSHWGSVATPKRLGGLTPTFRVKVLRGLKPATRPLRGLGSPLLLKFFGQKPHPQNPARRRPNEPNFPKTPTRSLDKSALSVEPPETKTHFWKNSARVAGRFATWLSRPLFGQKGPTQGVKGSFWPLFAAPQTPPPLLAKNPEKGPSGPLVPQRPNTFLGFFGQKGTPIAWSRPGYGVTFWSKVSERLGFSRFARKKTPKTPLFSKSGGDSGVLRTQVFFRFAKKQKGSRGLGTQTPGPFFAASPRKKYTVWPFWPYGVGILFFRPFGAANNGHFKAVASQLFFKKAD